LTHVNEVNYIGKKTQRTQRGARPFEITPTKRARGSESESESRKQRKTGRLSVGAAVGAAVGAGQLEMEK